MHHMTAEDDGTEGSAGAANACAKERVSYSVLTGGAAPAREIFPCYYNTGEQPSFLQSVHKGTEPLAVTTSPAPETTVTHHA
jgi:hypothetical protein